MCKHDPVVTWRNGKRVCMPCGETLREARWWETEPKCRAVVEIRGVQRQCRNLRRSSGGYCSGHSNGWNRRHGEMPPDPPGPLELQALTGAISEVQGCEDLAQEFRERQQAEEEL